MTPADFASRVILAAFPHDHITPEQREAIERECAEVLADVRRAGFIVCPRCTRLAGSKATAIRHAPPVCDGAAR